MQSQVTQKKSDLRGVGGGVGGGGERRRRRRERVRKGEEGGGRVSERGEGARAG